MSCFIVLIYYRQVGVFSVCVNEDSVRVRLCDRFVLRISICECDV